MSTWIAPEFADTVARLTPLSMDDLAAARNSIQGMLDRGSPARAAYAARHELVTEVLAVPGLDDDPSVAVRTYRRTQVSPEAPWVVVVHGGGFVLGGIDSAEMRAMEIAAAVDCVTVNVDFRMAPEAPFPASIRDVEAVIRFGRERFDGRYASHRIALYGMSGGAGISTGTLLALRDRGKADLVDAAFLTFPMVDDQELSDEGPWLTRDAARRMWELYLDGGRVQSPHAVPARAPSFAGFPPTFLAVAPVDPLRAGGLALGERLIREGVPVELHVYAGTFHGFDLLAPDTPISRRYLEDLTQAICRSLGAPATA